MVKFIEEKRIDIIVKEKQLHRIYIFQGDIQTIKVAVCSAVDVMQAMGSSLGSTLLEVT